MIELILYLLAFHQSLWYIDEKDNSYECMGKRSEGIDDDYVRDFVF